MKAKLIERLPTGLALYQISDNRVLLPGQWLSANKQQFPIFQCSDQLIQFVAPENSSLPDNFEISGAPIKIPENNNPLLLLADNDAIPLLFFLINYLRQKWGEKQLQNRILLILMGTESAFPFLPIPSQILIPDIPVGTIASSQYLEDLSLPARLASTNFSPGCFKGSLSEMMKQLKFDDFIAMKPIVITFGTKDLLDTTKKLFDKQPIKQLLVEFEN